MIFSIFRFFCTLSFQIFITNHTSIAILFIQLMHKSQFHTNVLLRLVLCSRITYNIIRTLGFGFHRMVLWPADGAAESLFISDHHHHHHHHHPHHPLFLPQVLGAELGLQELEELLSPDRILQNLVEAESPALHPLLSGVFTARQREKRRVIPLSESHADLQTHTHLASSSQEVTSSEIQGFDGSCVVKNGSYSVYCSEKLSKLQADSQQYQ